MPEIAFDPERDLFLARDVAASPEALWRGWTEPDLLKQWFCPKPWRVTDAEIDLRPGGIFRAAMAGPNGEVVDEGGGCWLEVVPNRKLVCVPSGTSLPQVSTMRSAPWRLNSGSTDSACWR